MSAFSAWLGARFYKRLGILADRNTKSYFQTFIENVLHKTKQSLRIFNRKVDREQIRIPVDSFRTYFNPTFRFYRSVFLGNTSRYAGQSLAGQARNAFVRGGRWPTLGFVGFVLTKKPSLLTELEEREGFTHAIRDSFSTVTWGENMLNIDKDHEHKWDISLSNLKFGDLLAKGCNAAVYSARLLDQKTEAAGDEKMENGQQNMNKEHYTNGGATEDGNTQPKIIVPHFEIQESGVLTDEIKVHKEDDRPCDDSPFDSSDLAVKVMFNYSAESNAFAIFNAMSRETLPAVTGFTFNKGCIEKCRNRRLRPHPNIVEMRCAFADRLPLLPGACENYPSALPMRLFKDGYGRNMTLFLVMKRYHCSLEEYLKTHVLNTATSILLFTQLLEGLTHLHQNNIAHRDLKTDNILVDLSYGAPRIAITDFGCCLEDLQLRYSSYDVMKGGNIALMAPEVLLAEPGKFSVIDYSTADLWTVGTLAYNIFGDPNPFTAADGLKPGTYTESELPHLQSSVPDAIRKLVRDILRRDPDQRPSQSLAATICQILLHAPASLLCGKFSKNSCEKALDWIFDVSIKTYVEASVPNQKLVSVPEFELRRIFCSRIQYLEVVDALKYIMGERND